MLAGGLFGSEPNMNFYKHHIGDYDSATAHLSMIEDAAYSRLIRRYYATEEPLPKEVAACARLVRAHSKAEVAAVAAMLREFFTLTDDGWHQKRCDKEITIAKAKAEINREVGKKGGRPRKNETKTDDLDNHQGSNMEPINNPDGFQTEPIKNPIQTPDSSNQTPDTRHHTPSAPLRVSRAGARERVGGFQKPVFMPPKSYAELEREEAEAKARELAEKPQVLQTVGVLNANR